MKKTAIYGSGLAVAVALTAAILYNMPSYTRLEPDWTQYPPVKAVQSDLGTVLGDIESHLPKGHPYKESDRVTWAHEGTHGINGYMRQKFSNQGKINCFYCLQDRAVVLQEPKTTLSNIARYVPPSLRGMMYKNYLIGMQGSWNNEPLYVFDEWDAYTNGTAAGLDLAEKGLWRGGQRADTVQFMVEFNVLALCLAYAVVDADNPGSEYDDASNFKSLMRWQIRRNMELLEKSKHFQQFNNGAADAYLEKLKTASDATQLRAFAQKYFGESWTKMVYGF